MRIDRKGRITIPASIRRQTGLLPHTEVALEVGDGTVRVVKEGIPVAEPGPGQRLVARLRGKGDIAMSTDEIMVLTRGE